MKKTRKKLQTKGKEGVSVIVKITKNKKKNS